MDLRKKSKRKASSWFLLSASRSPVPGWSRSPSVFLTLGSVRARHLIVLFCFVFWLCWVFVAVCRLSPVAAHGLLMMVASQLWSMSSRCSGFSSCGMWAQQLHQHLIFNYKNFSTLLRWVSFTCSKTVKFYLKSNNNTGFMSYWKSNYLLWQK